MNANLDEKTPLFPWPRAARSGAGACSSEPCRPRWSSSSGAAARVRTRWSNCRTWLTTVQSLCYIEHYPHALPPFWASTARLSGVHLHRPSVGHPRLDPVFRQLAGHVLWRPRALAWPQICPWLVSCVSSRGRRSAAVWSTCGRVLGALWQEILPGRSQCSTGWRQPRPRTCTHPLRSAALRRRAGRSHPSLSICRRIFDDPPD